MHQANHGCKHIVKTSQALKGARILQMKYCSLRSASPNVARSGKPLPTLDQLEGKLRLAKKVKLRDVWGLMLCQVPSMSFHNLVTHFHCRRVMKEMTPEAAADCEYPS